MRIRRHEGPTTLAKIRKGTLLEAVAKAAAKGEPAVLPPHNRGELRQALRRVLGAYVDTRGLNPILKGTGITAGSVRESGAVRWLHVGRTYYYSLPDVQRLLASGKPVSPAKDKQGGG